MNKKYNNILFYIYLHETFKIYSSTRDSRFTMIFKEKRGKKNKQKLNVYLLNFLNKILHSL